MPGLMGKLVGQFVLFADVVEHQYNTEDPFLSGASSLSKKYDGM